LTASAAALALSTTLLGVRLEAVHAAALLDQLLGLVDQFSEVHESLLLLRDG
jgi:hypothetical protein